MKRSGEAEAFEKKESLPGRDHCGSLEIRRKNT